MSWRCWGKAREDKDALAFYAASGAVGRTVIAPPNLDAEMTRMLRAGFDATMKDAAFLAEIESTKLEFEPMSGWQLPRRKELLSTWREERACTISATRVPKMC